MQAIGMRMVKTTIAVFLCFVIYLLRGAGIPFYSAIAAVLCMQPEIEDAKEKAKSRIIATFIGGFAGMMLLFFFQQVLGTDHELLRYGLISLMLIPLIYLTVWIKQPSASYLTCVVFMCICVSHAGDSNPVSFALNRMIDTLIGIIVALAINAFHLPHHKQTDILFDVPLTYLLKDGKLSTYLRIHLNRFLKEGMQLMISSSHTPAYLSSHMNAIHDNVHYILMDGVLYYHQKTQTCVALHEIPYMIWSQVYQMILAQGYDCFLYEISDEVLYIHHGPYHSNYHRSYYQSLRKKGGQRFINHEEELDKQYHGSCIMMMVLLKESEAWTLEEKIAGLMQDITWVLYNSKDFTGLKQLCIYSHMIAQDDPSLYLMRKLSCKQVEKIRVGEKSSDKETIKALADGFYHK